MTPHSSNQYTKSFSPMHTPMPMPPSMHNALNALARSIRKHKNRTQISSRAGSSVHNTKATEVDKKKRPRRLPSSSDANVPCILQLLIPSVVSSHQQEDPMQAGNRSVSESLSRKHFHNSIATSANNKPAVAAPADVANAFAAHSAVGDNILRADAFLERPETNASVVAGGDGFAAVFGEAKGGDGGRVREHGVCALTCKKKK